MNVIISAVLVCIAASIFCSCSVDRHESRSPIPERQPALSESRIDSIVSVLTLEEKVAMVHGNTIFTSPGVGRLGIRDLTMDDGPSGVREEVQKFSFQPLGLTTDSATFFPTGTALAATWNPDLAMEYGVALGEEARSRGKDVILAPAINIMRTPLCGRSFEYLSEDPMLNSRLAVAYIIGLQSTGTAACVKHYAANNQEINRGAVSVEMDERTLREIYLPAFRAAVEEAHVQSVMAAYNRFRGEYCSENSYLLTTILKKEWGFKGPVISDWGGTHSTTDAALNGLDLEMGSRRRAYFGDDLLAAVKAGSVPESVIDDKVRRILRVMAFTQNNPPASDGDAAIPGHARVAYDVAAQSIVLLKNAGSILPLDIRRIKTIAVVGDNAIRTQAIGGFGAGVKARREVTPLEGLKNKIGSSASVVFAQGYTSRISYERRFPQADKRPEDGLIREAAAAAARADAAIIFAGTNREVETEASDRPDLTLPFGQDELIRAVTSANPNTIVVVVAGAPVDLSTAIQSAPAVVYAWFNGSEGGNAVADVLFGTVNPSGKLPFTFPVSLNDEPAQALNAYPGSGSVSYEEGILNGYRWFDMKKIEPQFCFGYGLSYTTFEYSGLHTDSASYAAGDTVSLSLKVKNAGSKDGLETVEIYIGANDSKIPRAVKELKAFKKVPIAAGSDTTITITIPVRDLAYYDVREKKWSVEAGAYTIYAGGSSRDIKATTAISVR